MMGTNVQEQRKMKAVFVHLRRTLKEPMFFNEHVIKDLTVDEMKGALKVLGKPNLESLSDQEMREAIKLFYPL